MLRPLQADMGTAGFFENSFPPAWQEEPWLLSKAKKDIRHGEIRQNACI
jgi:hypothetical protein